MQVSRSGKEGAMPRMNFLRAANEIGEMTYPTDCAHLFYFLCVQYLRWLPGGLDLRKRLAYNYRVDELGISRWTQGATMKHVPPVATYSGRGMWSGTTRLGDNG